MFDIIQYTNVVDNIDNNPKIFKASKKYIVFFQNYRAALEFLENERQCHSSAMEEAPGAAGITGAIGDTAAAAGQGRG